MIRRLIRLARWAIAIASFAWAAWLVVRERPHPKWAEDPVTGLRFRVAPLTRAELADARQRELEELRRSAAEGGVTIAG